MNGADKSEGQNKDQEDEFKTEEEKKDKNKEAIPTYRRHGICSLSGTALEYNSVLFGVSIHNPNPDIRSSSRSIPIPVPILSQTQFSIRGIKLIDHSSDTAIHRNLIYSTGVDVDTDVERERENDSSSSSTKTNTIELHLSSYRDEKPLLEVKLKHIRILWLQRGCMTVINFFKDHFLQGINNIEYATNLKNAASNPSALPPLAVEPEREPIPAGNSISISIL